MYDISQKIDGFNLELLKKIKEITEKLQIDYFIVGATVRDIILNYVYDIIIYRKTNDIDFAVRVKNWDEYKLLVSEMEKAGFTKIDNIIHRYSYKGMLIDFIPFGDISTNGDIIIWPDKYETELSVIGFDEAFINVDEIRIQNNPEIIIKIASVECLVMLKFFSWQGRSADSRLKDAKDLYLIITTYLDAGNLDRLLEEHTDLFVGEVDYELSAARLLGRDIKKVVSEKIVKNMQGILNDENLLVLATDMSQYEGVSLDRNKKIDRCIELVKSLLKGFEDEVS